jgi:hypothetical protein
MNGLDGSGSRAAALRIALGLVSGAGAAAAAWLLLSPDAPSPGFVFGDKVWHLLGFVALAGPGVLALPRRVHAFWLGHVTALAEAIEVVQSLDNKGRERSVWDFLADAAGIALAAVIERAHPPPF